MSKTRFEAGVFMKDFKKSFEMCMQQALSSKVNPVEEYPTINPMEKQIILNNREIAREIAQKPELKGFEETYNLLNDDYSRELYLKLLAFKVLGATKVALPLSDKNLWIESVDFESLCMDRAEPAINCGGISFNLFDLKPLGHNYRVFTTGVGILFAYVFQEYEYHKNDIDFMPEEGDYVIDGGAFVGDTALYFADAIGQKGKVFSFEFVKGNLELVNKNLNLNPHLKERIEIYENALWSNSQEHLYMYEAGPATKVLMEEFPGYTSKIPSKSIDDLMKEQNIEKMDLIKLDIEGAELECLKGAQKTIDKFQPKLAICIYHKPDDFITIPQYIKNTHPYYDLYIDHHTASLGETVLYCVPQNRVSKADKMNKEALTV